MDHLLLLLMLAGVSHALFPAAQTSCNATGNTSHCTSTRGGSVYIQVMTNASRHLLLCTKQLPTGAIDVFTLRKEKVTIQGPFKNRTEFFINNGTLKITNVEKSDAGQYKIEIFDQSGFHLRNIEIQLDVQDNILPILIIVCSAAGLLLILVILCCVQWRF
ncbi:uncharacterized protein LOC121516449 isoform X2 [Xyrichtys novacula]|uniref:Uncharacterized protein LOC121516449 isoform X2 n=1 Tax=Xyrichtys novacula TaxID=13765 RepID=A0AAV1FBY1_XYRNO|nr:uncharacterized protein LOC121516449 isoform X2 [Xyrichtys novacula]